MTASFVLQVLGLVIEIAGAMLLGRAFVTRVRSRHFLKILVSALFGMDYAKSYVHVAPANDDADRKAIIFDGLRGSALLWIGFLLQLGAVIMQWLSTPN